MFLSCRNRIDTHSARLVAPGRRRKPTLRETANRRWLDVRDQAIRANGTGGQIGYAKTGRRFRRRRLAGRQKRRATETGICGSPRIHADRMCKGSCFNERRRHSGRLPPRTSPMRANSSHRTRRSLGSQRHSPVDLLDRNSCASFFQLFLELFRVFL